MPLQMTEKQARIANPRQREGLECENCRFDVMMKDGNPIRYYEYKSYSDASNISLEQFKNYIGSITDIKQLRYIFNESKLTVEQARSQMLTFMKNKAGEIWNANPKLFNNLFLKNGKNINNAKSFETFLNEIDSKNSFLNFIETFGL